MDKNLNKGITKELLLYLHANHPEVLDVITDDEENLRQLAKFSADKIFLIPDEMSSLLSVEDLAILQGLSDSQVGAKTTMVNMSRVQLRKLSMLITCLQVSNYQLMAHLRTLWFLTAPLAILSTICAIITTGQLLVPLTLLTLVILVSAWGLSTFSIIEKCNSLLWVMQVTKELAIKYLLAVAFNLGVTMAFVWAYFTNHVLHSLMSWYTLLSLISAIFLIFTVIALIYKNAISINSIKKP